MALSQQQAEDTIQLAKSFVEHNVECNSPDSMYKVSSNTAYTIEEALKKSMERCQRVAVQVEDVAERDEVLQEALLIAIEALECEL